MHNEDMPVKIRALRTIYVTVGSILAALLTGYLYHIARPTGAIFIQVFLWFVAAIFLIASILCMATLIKFTYEYFTTVNIKETVDEVEDQIEDTVF